MSATTRRDPEATRHILLDAAYEEIYANGFRAASLDNILASTGVTKGALYHHFGNKQKLGYAVVDERVKPLIRERYLHPLSKASDPIVGLHRMGTRMQEEFLKEGILEKGCPVNNLVLEMSGLDEGFRLRLAAILDEWIATVADGIRRAQASGVLQAGIDPRTAAAFIVASYQGACGVVKNAQDIDLFVACREGIDAYVESLRLVS